MPDPSRRPSLDELRAVLGCEEQVLEELSGLLERLQKISAQRADAEFDEREAWRRVVVGLAARDATSTDESSAL